VKSPPPEPPTKSVWESFNIDVKITDILKKPQNVSVVPAE